MPASTSLKVKALTDIWSFCDLINFKGGSSNFAAVHRKLAGFLTAPQTTTKFYTRRRLTLMPRGHLKSTVGSVLYVLWRIYRNPNIRILVGCNKRELSNTFMRELRQYLEDVELQENVWNKRPHIAGRLVPVMDSSAKKRRDEEVTETADKKLIWTTFAIQVLRVTKDREPTVLATSVGSRVVGQHYDLLVLDDIVDFDNVGTQQKIDRVFEWAQDLESVLDPPKNVTYGRVGAVSYSELVGDEIVIHGTRYDANDYYSYIIENAKKLKYKVFTRNIYRNGVDSTAGYIWEQRFTNEYVSLLRARTTARRWASQYLNEIQAQEDNVLDYQLVKFYASAWLNIKDATVHLQLKEDGVKRSIKPYLVVDVATSMSSSSDNTVVTVGGMDADNTLFVFDVKRGKFTPSQTVDYIYEMCDKWNINTVNIETVGVGAVLPYNIRERFKKQRPLVIVPITNRSNKHERIEQRLQPLLANSKLYLPDWLAVNKEIESEFVMFRRSTAKDDFIDTLEMLCSVAKPTRRMSSGKSVVHHRVYNSKYGGVR